MTDLRTAAQQALEALESDPVALNAINNACAVLRAALAQQADTTDPGNDVDVLREHVRHLERRIRELHAQQAEPLNLSDPAVQKRLASQWGYVPAAQAEPVAGVVLNEDGRAALVEHGREEWHCAARNARRLYTAPPQRKPLTEEEIESCRQKGYAHAGLGAPFDFGKAARAVERAHGIKEN